MRSKDCNRALRKLSELELFIYKSQNNPVHINQALGNVRWLKECFTDLIRINKVHGNSSGLSRWWAERKALKSTTTTISDGNASMSVLQGDMGLQRKEDSLCKLPGLPELGEDKDQRSTKGGQE